MSDKPNPYESPESVDARESWWARIRRLFRVIDFSHSPAFADGEALICKGIAFFIDPQNSLVAYAASPSADCSSRRMSLIVSEAIRILPIFLADHPDVHEQLRGRKLAVRIVESYAGARSAYQHEFPLEWDILNTLLSDDPEDRINQQAQIQ